MINDITKMCMEIGNVFGEYFEENNQFCIDNGEQVFRYNTEKELLTDWVETLVLQHISCNGEEGGNWENEVKFIYENVIGKYPTGIRFYNGVRKKRYVVQGYVADGTLHGKMEYLGTFDSLIDAICVIWKHKGVLV